MNNSLISHDAFLIYKESKIRKKQQDKKDSVVSIKTFCEDDLKKIQKIKEGSK